MASDSIHEADPEKAGKTQHELNDAEPGTTDVRSLPSDPHDLL
jgi:hypothetical protein